LRRAIFLVAVNLISVLLAEGANKSDREIHGLKGPVGSVRVEVATLSRTDGKIVEGPRVRTEKRVYDDKGNLRWESFYNSESVLSSHFYSYHSDGTQTETAHIRRISTDAGAASARGMSTNEFKWTHRNDAAGNRTESFRLADGGRVVRTVAYTYDKAGKLTSEAQDQSSEGGSSLKWDYDSAGNVKQGFHFDKDGLLLELDTYSYEFDAQKNWVKRVTSRQLGNGKSSSSVPKEVTYRTITYYAPVGDFQMNGGLIPGGLPRSATGRLESITGQARKRVQAVYPTAARAARISGDVIVEVTVDEEGDVLSARATSGHPLLKEAALDAAWDWKFSPVMYQGRAVKIIGAIVFNFNL
jgi:TonB family protein